MRDTVQFCSVLNLSGDRVFQDPSVYPVVSILKRTDDNDHPTAYAERDVETRRVEKVRELEAKDLDALPDCMFSLLLSEYSDELSAVLSRCSRLADVAKVNATSTAAEADALSQVIAEYEPGATPLVNTGAIDRYLPQWGISPLLAQRKTYTRPAIQLSEVELSNHRRRIYAAPKIVFAKMALRPEAFLDGDGAYCSINTNCVHASDLPLEFLIGILNSKSMAFIYDQFFGSLRMSGGYLQFQAPQARALPIPALEPEAVQAIVDNVTKLLEAANELIEVKRSVVGLLVADFGLRTTSRKLGDFETLTWQQFATEVENRGEPLTGDAREDWFQRFEIKVAEVRALQETMKELDQSVDQLACERSDSMAN